jgi:hypothetical protein
MKSKLSSPANTWRIDRVVEGLWRASSPKGASVGGLFCFKIDFISTGFLFVDLKGSTFV